MSGLMIRQYVSARQDTLTDDRGVPLLSVCRKVWVAAVVRLPEGDAVALDAFADMGEHLGYRLGQQAKDCLDAPVTASLAYGKGALVGSHCAMEQAAALLHPKLGKSLRTVLGQGPALIPSTMKRATPGVSLDIPLHGAQNEWDFAMLDSVTVMLEGAPLPNEVVVAVALAYGARAAAVIGRSN